jgi:polar amino acid transport system permease protein
VQRTKPKFGPLDALIIVLLIVEVILLGRWLQVEYGYQWRWHQVPKYILRVGPDGLTAGPLLIGLGNTILISISGTVLALVIGLPMALMRGARALLPRLVAGSYVQTVRNLPPLILLFIMAYFVLRGLPDMLVGMVGLALYEGAYITEIIRAGIEGVPPGQSEAAHSLGLSRFHELRHIILPQAFRDVLPSLTGQFISAIKISAIVSLISVQELTFKGNQIASSARLGMEMWLTVAALYLVLTLSCSLAFSALEDRLSRHRTAGASSSR